MEIARRFDVRGKRFIETPQNIIIVGDNITKSRYENGIIIMSIYDFLLDMDSLNY